MSFLDVVVQFLSKPAILVGLVALIGLLAQKKPIETVISGTFKTTLGFLILGGGAGIVISAITPLGVLIEKGFGLKGTLPVNEVFTALAQAKFGQQMALIMFFGFIANLLFARFTPFKYIFLTGHHTLFMSTVAAGVLGLSGLHGWPLILVGALIVGATSVLFPALSSSYMKRITGGDTFVMGHYGTLSYVTAGFLGKFVGNPKDSTENLRIPAWAGFMKEPLVAMGVVMTVIYWIAAGVAGGGEVGKFTSDWWILWSLIQALTFAGGIGVILLGVRMILADIVPAFRGIAERIVPEARPALDCPTVFPYAPNAVLVGYLFSIVGGLVVLFFQGSIGWTLILPSMIVHFFVGGTAGVFGNATGGWKGAALGGFVNGLLFTLLAGFLSPVLASLDPKLVGNTFGDTDFSVVGLILYWIGKLF
ncbi:MAG: PTS ascorbate transporter subunit IIC [Symbiobacteriia bacterium]